MSSPAFRVFISAASSEFEAARAAIASDLRSRGIEVKFQDDFRQEAEADTTLRKLHDYIHDCSAVISLVGNRSGSVPPPAAAEPFADVLPEGIDRASYTQWEVLLALYYGRRLSIYRANDDYRPDRPETEASDSLELQERFVTYLFKEQGLDRSSFSTIDELGRLVLREDWPKVITRKPVLLPDPSLGDLFKGRDGFLEQLRESLERVAGHATAIVAKAVHGLGGVGKTRLAVEYAWRRKDDYTALLFVAAETPQLLNQNLAALTGPAGLDLPEHDVPDENVQSAAALRWLTEHPGWLLILDNVDTP